MSFPPASLIELSAAMGANPAWVQGAGGNTSEKAEGTIWVKASGALLANAKTETIFLPLDLSRARTALSRGEDAQEAVIREHAPAGLRPSIETALHVAMSHRVVAHTHCVNAISYAIRRDAETALADRLSGLRWAFVPYSRPGAPLAAAVAKASASEPDILILANHGLVVGSAEAAGAMALTREVDRRLANVRTSQVCTSSHDVLAQVVADTGWTVPLFPEIHQLAFSPARDKLCAGSLYPDHVVFLGPGPVPLIPLPRLQQYLHSLTEKFPVLVVVPDAGVVVCADAMRGAHEMARCLALVSQQVDPDADLVYLSQAQEQELLSWDAETYRQALERARSATASV